MVHIKKKKRNYWSLLGESMCCGWRWGRGYHFGCVAKKLHGIGKVVVSWHLPHQHHGVVMRMEWDNILDRPHSLACDGCSLPILWLGTPKCGGKYSDRIYPCGIPMFCCCSVSKSRLTLCDPTDCHTPGFPVLPYLPKFAQTHVHCVSDV